MSRTFRALLVLVGIYAKRPIGPAGDNQSTNRSFYVLLCYPSFCLFAYRRTDTFNLFTDLGPFLSSNFSTKFPLFFPRKTGKAGKTGNISKVWKFNRGKNIWKASYSNIRKKKSGNLDKKSFDKNGPYIIRYTLSNYQVWYIPLVYRRTYHSIGLPTYRWTYKPANKATSSRTYHMPHYTYQSTCSDAGGSSKHTIASFIVHHSANPVGNTSSSSSAVPRRRGQHWLYTEALSSKRQRSHSNNNKALHNFNRAL